MFDTLRYSKILEAVGVSREQAEAHIKIIAEVVETDLATKQDLRELEHRLVIKIAAAGATIAGLSLALLGLYLNS